ncbi:MAG TPA: hypothetical protein VFY36_06945 [Solirubrobacteraceae bacterium]|nr:hypothetical protein [Solirubrobacteraceae bacterium]
MAAKGRLGKAGEAAHNNQYLQRLIEDEELRSSLFSAYDAARNAYARVSNGKPAGWALLDDSKFHEELKSAAGALRDASGALREPARPARKSRGGAGRSLMLLTVGAVLAIALSGGLRSKVLDLLFGAEEEFEYSSTTTPATPAPAAVASS